MAGMNDFRAATPPERRLRFADRLLSEWVCRREEAAGHPAESPAADAAARLAGGDMVQRLHRRAAALPGAEALQAQIHRSLRAVRAIGLALLLLGGLSGVTAAAAALDGSPPSLPLILVVVVGLNLGSLLLWGLLQLGRPELPPGIARLLRAVALAYSRRRPNPQAPLGELLPLLVGGAHGRWLGACLVHTFWLAFALAALATLALLLSLRAYDLSWVTTLLSDAALARLADALSLGPRLLELDPAAGLAVTDVDGPAWSRWLLAAVFVYGVLPRALALGLSALALQRARSRYGGRLTRPGYARLHQRLYAGPADLGVRDAAATATPPPPARPPAPAPTGPVHGFALEVPSDPGPPPLADVRWTWLGVVDDAASRAALLARLRQDAPRAVAVWLRATQTPDRGLQHFLTDVVRASRAPVTLMLGDHEALARRGGALQTQREADWSRLASAAGCVGALPLPAERSP
jgi:hypothetical protein